MLFKCSRRTIAVAVAATLHAVVSCGDDDPEPSSPSAGTSGISGSGASGGSAGAGGSGGIASAAGSNGSGSGADASAGATAGIAGNSGASGTSGSAGSSAVGSGGASSSDGGPPPPADGGGSIYAVQCRNDSRPCGFPAAYCLGIQLPDGGNGFTCSNDCRSNADCSTAPSGAEAQAGCVPFTQRSRCVLVCENSGTRSRCPGGMTCYTFPGAQIGYCLWP